MKSKAKPTKGSARTKRFDVGGTVGALAGLGTLAFLINREKNKQKGVAESGGMSKDPNAPSVMDRIKAGGEKDEAKAEEDRKKDIFKKNPQYFGGNPEDKPGGGGNVGTRTDTERPNSAARRTSAEIKSNVLNKRPEQVRVQTAPQSTETVQGVDEKKLDKLQRRNVGTGKKTAPAKKASSTDDVIGAGIAAGNKQSKTTEAALNVIKTLKPGQQGFSGSRESKPYPEKEAAAKKIGSANATALSPTDKEIRDIKDKQSGAIRTEERRRKGQGLTPYASTGANKVRESELFHAQAASGRGIKKGGMVKKYANGGSVMASKMGSVKTAKPSMRSASSRADGIAQRGKTRA